MDRNCLSRGKNLTGRERVLKKEIKVQKLLCEPILGDPGVVSWVRKTVAKVFKKGREGPWDVTLNKPVSRLIRMFVSQSEASIALLS